jgi:cell division protein FtsN
MHDRSTSGGKDQPTRRLGQWEKPTTGAARAGVLAILLWSLIFQPGCMLRKPKAATPRALPSPVRLVLLPSNIPEQDSEQRWLAMTAVALMGQISSTTPDLEVVPVWEAMPIVIEVAGAARTLDAEMASFIATRLGAKWAAQGDLSSKEESFSLMVDFIPAKANLIPFRFGKQGQVAQLKEGFTEAFRQFLRYLSLRPLPNAEADKTDVAAVREIAEALDREYGWFREAEPGKAENIVKDLFSKNARLAQLLFNPALYGGASPSRPAAKPQSSNQHPAADTPAIATDGATTPRSGNSLTPLKSLEAATGAATDVGAMNTNPPISLPRANPGRTETAATADTTPFEMPPSMYFTQRRNPRTFASDPEKTISESTASPEAAKIGKPAERNKASPTPPRRSFGIQVFSSRQKADAEGLATKIAKSGWQATIEEGDLQARGIWYRIRIRGYASLQAAKEVGKKLQESGLIKDYWIIP